MKVLIISDSHGFTDELDAIKERHHDVEHMIHCGDSELPHNHPSLYNFQAVRGNCDFDRALPNEIIKENGDVRFFITHGHLYNIKMSLLNLSYRAKEVRANIVCYGHSHLAGAESINNVIYMNPGSICLPRLRKEKTYIILEIENSQALIEFYDIDGNVISSLTKQYHLH
jgi:putative phosphoesterase